MVEDRHIELVGRPVEHQEPAADLEGHVVSLVVDLGACRQLDGEQPGIHVAGADRAKGAATVDRSRRRAGLQAVGDRAEGLDLRMPRNPEPCLLLPLHDGVDLPDAEMILKALDAGSVGHLDGVPEERTGRFDLHPGSVLRPRGARQVGREPDLEHPILARPAERNPPAHEIGQRRRRGIPAIDRVEGEPFAQEVCRAGLRLERQCVTAHEAMRPAPSAQTFSCMAVTRAPPPVRSKLSRRMYRRSPSAT